MRWFRDAFCAEEKLIAERLGIDTYTLLEEMASRVPPGSWGVMPIFSDRMRFKTWYHAAPSFINLSIDPDKCNKATLLQAEVQKGNYGVKFSLMSRDYPSIFRWSKKPPH